MKTEALVEEEEIQWTRKVLGGNGSRIGLSSTHTWTIVPESEDDESITIFTLSS